MKTLDAPVYEIKQNSEWYISTVKRRLQIKEFFQKVNSEYFTDNGFSFYTSEHFGIQGCSKDYETYKDEVMKNPNKDGVHIFKKRLKFYELFKGMIEQIEETNPFKSTDVFGLNNLSASQWIGERWFFGVRNSEYIKDKESKEITSIEYKDYLKIVMENLD